MQRCQGIYPQWTSQVALVVKNPPANAGDTGDVGSIPGSQKSSEVGNGNPLKYFCLENPMGRGAWRATVHGTTKIRTQLSDWTELNTVIGLPWWLRPVKYLPAMQETWVWSLGWENPLKEEMATHSSIFAWRIPRTEEPEGLQSKGSQREWQDWAINTFTF